MTVSGGFKHLDPCVLGLCTGRKQDWEEDLTRDRGLAKDQDWD